MKRKRRMTQKVTAQELSVGVKAIIFVLPFLMSGAGILVSVSWSGGQTTEKITNCVEQIHVLQDKVEDSAKVKEQTAVDIAVMKTEIRNMSNNIDDIKELLQPTNKRKKPD